MGFELNILDWFQTLHTPVMDKLMTSVTKLGDAGYILDYTDSDLSYHTENEKDRCDHGSCAYRRFIIM